MNFIYTAFIFFLKKQYPGDLQYEKIYLLHGIRKSHFGNNSLVGLVPEEVVSLLGVEWLIFLVFSTMACNLGIIKHDLQ